MGGLPRVRFIGLFFVAVINQNCPSILNEFLSNAIIYLGLDNNVTIFILGAKWGWFCNASDKSGCKNLSFLNVKNIKKKKGAN